MNKKIKILLFSLFILLFTFIVKIDDVKAACSVHVSSPKSAVVGSTFKVSATVSSDVGSWYYVLSYDSSKVQLVSGNPKVVGVIGDSKTSSYTFKAISSGTTSFKAVNLSLASNSTNAQCSASAGSSSITMKTQAEIEAGYSKNNNLSSLSVEGGELTPAFDKNNLEYSVTLPVDTTKAIINATLEDKTASITGIGEVDVIDGINKKEVVVTAQHGEKKTYVLNITVKELDPIKVKVDGKEYTVVRKKGQIESIPTGFIESTVTINDQEIAAYKNEAAKLTLVVLKDDKDNKALFIYDEKKKKYSKFNEVTAASVNLLILDEKASDVPKDFKEKTFKIEGKSINGYKLKGDTNDRYYLVYAQNMETGNKGLYLYDSRDKTFQIYFSDIVDLKNKDINTRNYIIIGLGLFTLLLLIIILAKNKKIRKLKNRFTNDSSSRDEKTDSYELDDLDDRPVVKEISEDEYTIRKKSKKQKLEEIRKAKERLDRSKPSYRKVSLEDDDYE